MNRRAFLASSAAVPVAPLLSVASAENDVRFDAELVREDLDAIWVALLDVGAEPFLTSARSTVEDRYRVARAAITSAMTTREAWLAIAPVLGALNDGHVGLGFPDPLNAAPRRFPLRFALSDDDALVVATDRTNTIPVNSRIVSVNDISAEQYRDVTLTAFGGQTRALHRSRVSGSGAWTSTALFGVGPTYDVRWVTPHGSRHAGRIPVVPAETATHTGASHARDPYTYRRLRNDTVGFIDYRSCEDLPRFKRFLETTFRDIRAKPVRAVVIDVRSNGGGDSSLNDVLWTYVSTKPFKQFGGEIVKACERLKREYGRDRYIEIYGSDAWLRRDGTMLRRGADPNEELIVPGPLDVRFTGPVYLLISTQTFSSAMACALAAKDYGLATIVGEETGEPVMSTGEIYTYTTPTIGLRAYLTTTVFLPPKPQPAGQGVIPDVIVTTEISDSEAGRDPVLERVFAMISAQPSNSG